MVDVRVEVDAAATELAFDRLQHAMSASGLAIFLSTTPVEYLQKRAKDRFASEGDDVSGKWAPLRPATQVIRGNHPEWPVGPEHPINVRTGELENWVTGGTFIAVPFGDGASLTYPREPSGGELRKKVETAQMGRDRTVPRPVLGINEADVVFITTQLFFYLEESVK